MSTCVPYSYIVYHLVLSQLDLVNSPSPPPPVKGFHIFYRPFTDSSSTSENSVEYMKLIVPGQKARRAVIAGLAARTVYSIRMVCFNEDGQSPYSNEVAKETIGT